MLSSNDDPATPHLRRLARLTLLYHPARRTCVPIPTVRSPDPADPVFGPARCTYCQALTKPGLVGFDQVAGSSVAGEATPMWRGDDDMVARALQVRRDWRMRVLRGSRK